LWGKKKNERGEKKRLREKARFRGAHSKSGDSGGLARLQKASGEGRVLGGERWRLEGEVKFNCKKGKEDPDPFCV